MSWPKVFVIAFMLWLLGFSIAPEVTAIRKELERVNAEGRAFLKKHNETP